MIKLWRLYKFKIRDCRQLTDQPQKLQLANMVEINITILYEFFFSQNQYTSHIANVWRITHKIFRVMLSAITSAPHNIR